MMKNSNKPRYNNSAKQSAEPDTLPVYVQSPDGGSEVPGTFAPLFAFLYHFSFI